MHTNHPALRRTFLTAGSAALLFAGAFGVSAQGGAQAPTPVPGVAAPAPPATPGRGGRNPNANADFSPKDPIPARTGPEQARTFAVPPGYRMELVAAEPDVISPAVIEFDGNGRMYVIEFVSYMLDADGNGAHQPISRITRFESTRGDGRYDKRTVFADKLILPRMVLPLEDGVILTNETDSDDVVKLSDTNGDGVADKKEVVYSGVGTGRDGNLEHQQNGFVWGLDNWIYSTYNTFRFRWTPRGFIREPTGPNGGQWGVTQDDDGKMWFICGGCERGPTNFQIPVQYSSAPILPDRVEPGFYTVWPIVGLADTQGGMGRVRVPVGVLNNFTAGSGGEIVRADRLPEDLRGDLLVGEPVGRLIRRARIVKTEGVTELRNVYQNSEFILSSDPYFRPINMKNGPDGTIYIADMYHGIIQDSQWTLPGSYLRRKIEQYQLDKVINLGRIWRLRYDGLPEVPATPAQPNAGATPGSPAVPGIAPNFTPPRMYAETPAQIVAHLSHANGWWRDTAQRLLVLKQDRSIVPALQTVVRTSPNLMGRFHALWTLEGLGALDAGLVRDVMKDPNPRLRVQAIRASETLYKAGNRSFDPDYRALATDADADVSIQAMLTLKVLKAPDVPAVVASAQKANTGRGVKEVGDWLVRPAAAGRGGAAVARTPAEVEVLARGETIYNELCASCHGADGLGQPLVGADPGVTMAPPLAGSPRLQGHRDYVTKVLLHGLTGPVDQTTYTQVMVPMGATNRDDWIAAIGSYVRNNFGNTGTFVRPADVARVRLETAARRRMWTVEEVQASLPVLLPAQPTWQVTSSHNVPVAPGAITLAGWTTAAPQEPGMWLQVALPSPVSLAEIQFESPAGTNGFGIGSLGGGTGGRGGGNSTAPAAGGGGNRGRGAAAPTEGPAPPPPGFYPRGYTVQVSTDGTRWSAPVAIGQGAPGLAVASFRPVQARFVRITCTTADPQAWSMKNLRLYGAGGAPR